MNAVGDVADRNFGGWPAWKQRLEDPPAEFTVQAADTETERGPALRQISHVERLVLVQGIDAAQPQNVVRRHAPAVRFASAERQVPAQKRQVLAQQAGRKRIETGRHRRVGGEDIAGARRPQRLPESQIRLDGEVTRPLDDGECRMSFVDVADLGIRMECLDDAPAADAKHDLLHQSCLASTAIELCRYAAVGRAVERIVAVQQIELHVPDGRLPHAQMEHATRQFEPYPQPSPVLENDRLDRHHRRIIVGVELLLDAVGVDDLAKIPFLIQQPDSKRRDVEIAGRLQIIAGQDAEPAGIERQCRAETEFHAEIGNPGKRRLAVVRNEPSGPFEIFLPRRHEAGELLAKGSIRGQSLQSPRRCALQDAPGIFRATPQPRIDALPKSVGFVAPGPAQVERKRPQGGDFRRQIRQRQCDHEIRLYVLWLAETIFPADRL